MGTFLTIVIAVAVFGLLVIVHEIGHMLVAKRCGVRVDEFTIGFGPKLFSIKTRETTYALRLIPFGGAVVMPDEEDAGAAEDTTHEKPRKKYNLFNKVSKWKRFLILFAGSFMNFVMGIIIVLLLYLPAEQVTQPVIGSFVPGAILEQNGDFQVGDRVLQIDGYDILIYNDISVALMRTEGQDLHEAVVLRDGQRLTLSDIPIKHQTFTLENGEQTELYGFQFVTKEATFLDKLDFSYKNCLNFARMVWVGLSDIVSGRVGANELSGPVGISVALGETAAVSMPSMWFLVAFISINLGIVNMLPLPALDGGRILFLVVEAIRRKPIDPKRENMVHMIGLALFMLLFVYITFNDIVRQFVGG